MSLNFYNYINDFTKNISSDLRFSKIRKLISFISTALTVLSRKCRVSNSYFSRLKLANLFNLQYLDRKKKIEERDKKKEMKGK